MKPRTPYITYLAWLLLALLLVWPSVYADEIYLADASGSIFSFTEKRLFPASPLSVADAQNISIAFIDLSPESNLYRVIKYAGKFHLLLIHFPIAFLLGAVVAQWVAVFQKTAPSTLVRVFLWAGSTGAVIAATLGWMFAYDSVYFGDSVNLLFWHRWLGTSTAVISAVALVLAPRLRPVALGIVLTVCGGLLVAAAHFGGSLARGPEFLMEF